MGEWWKPQHILFSWAECSLEVLNIHWKNWCWSWSSNPLATWCEDLTHWKRPWCWERLKAGAEGDDRGWDGWMASPTQWTRVWASCRSWWWTEKPGMLQPMGSQRIGLNWVTEMNYDYTVEVTNRFKGLDLIDWMPEELWTEVRNMYRRWWPKPSQKKKKCKKAIWLSEEAYK